MRDGRFRYEDDRLKHYVRTVGWLPRCQRRHERLRANRPLKRSRRLRYFTFCGVGAVDALMLDVAQILRRSDSGRFDTVYFFARNPSDVLETQKRIPGAIGFSGEFESTVLETDPDEAFLEGLAHPLDIPAEQLDVESTRQRQRVLETQRQLYLAFPFDIINLDVEGYLFRPTDQIPGALIRSLCRVLRWQKQPLRYGRFTETLNEFTLMFTTKLGPANLNDDYKQMLVDVIDRNIEEEPGLRDVLLARTGCGGATELEDRDFRNLFLLGAPKLISAALMDEDWYVDPDSSIQVFEFERVYEGGVYSMIHLVLDVRRKHPTADLRPPRTDPEDVVDAYRNVVRGLFEGNEILVTDQLVADAVMKPSLEEIDRRRRLYHPF